MLLLQLPSLTVASKYVLSIEPSCDTTNALQPALSELLFALTYFDCLAFELLHYL